MIGARAFIRLFRDIREVVGAPYAAYLGLVVLSGLMEGATLASVVPLLVLAGVGSRGTDGSGRMVEFVSSAVGRLGFAPTLPSVGIVVLSTVAVSALVFVLCARLGARLQAAYVFRWRQRLIAAIFGARWSYLVHCRQGDLLNAVVMEAQQLAGAFYQTGVLLTGVVHSLVFISVAAALSAPTTMLILGGGAVLFLATRPLASRAYRIGKQTSAENAALHSAATELIAGAKLVKATATEGEAVHVLATTADRLRRRFQTHAVDVQLVKAVFDFGAAALLAGVLIANATWFAVNPATTVVILAIFVRLMPKLSEVQQSAQWLAGSLATVESLHATVAQAEADAERAAEEPLPEALREGPLAVAANAVSVRYGDLAALSNVTLQVAPGSCVALVGGSGAGKSTLVDAILGLVPLAAGDITVNGVSLAQLPLASLRRRIGYVGQETLLYNASIRDNVQWGRLPRSEDELDASMRLAGADAFVRRLPAGYDAPVGDRGALLSGGERQRLGLARAVLGRPGLLILDEVTSALDAESERAVMSAVAALKGRTTIVIIAHRLSSVRIADTICVLERGAVVEHGPWDELMRRRGRLHELWSLQQTEQRQADVYA